MLPRKDDLIAADKALDAPNGRVLRSDTQEELWDGQARSEAVKPRMFTEDPPVINPHSNGHGNGHSNGRSNGHTNGDGLVFEDVEDDVNLDIESYPRLFKKF